MWLCALQVVSTLGPGQYFGERALWKANHPRAATAISQTACTFYTLERTHFQRMLGPLDQIWRFEALQRVPILFNLTDSQLSTSRRTWRARRWRRARW